MNSINRSEYHWPNPTIDLEVWMLNDYHVMQERVIESGYLTKDIARFGLYIPKALITDKRKTYPYTMFQSKDKEFYKMKDQYKIDDNMLIYIIKHLERCTHALCSKLGYFKPTHCNNDLDPCATVLSSYNEDTNFVIDHINELKLKLNVYWMGDKLRKTIKYLLGRYSHESFEKKMFLVLHWTPSEIIDGSDEFVPIQMPRCEDYRHNETGCKYEMIPMLKYFAAELSNAPYAVQVLNNFQFDSLKPLIKLYEQRLKSSDTPTDMTMEQIYNNVSCIWLQANEATYKKWIPREKAKREIYIGGIFPITGAGNQYKSIMSATNMAQYAINADDSILPNHRLIIMRNDGECKPDIVLKRFITYYMQRSTVIGVLGPACSETVEPIAGISKHFKMAVISYSAEGVSFSDREQYPYFFRTIGENSQ